MLIKDESFTADVCESINDGIFVVIDDVNFIVNNLANFGADLTNVLETWNELLADLPFDHLSRLILQVIVEVLNSIDAVISTASKQLRHSFTFPMFWLD